MLDDPDMTFTLTDPDDAVQFLKGESFAEFAPIPRKDYSGLFEFRYTTGWKTIGEGQDEKKESIRKDVMSATFDKEKRYHPIFMERLPMFRNVSGPWRIPEADEEEFGAYIPINQSLGTFENEILPIKVFKHFFDKASNIVLLNDCGCRVNRECKDHNHSIGCMQLGDDSFKLKLPPERGRVITKEEALETLTLAIEDGLIPVLGRAKGEARGFGIEETGHFMSMCFCCTCCCINAKVLTYGSVSNGTNFLFHRMEGVTVTVDEELCVGCGECLEVCAFSGMRMTDEIAYVNQDRCLGCGRCESVCPSEAITISIDDVSRVNELIKTLESHVDVAPQVTANNTEG
jgi:UDP-glucose 4-epimerase